MSWIPFFRVTLSPSPPVISVGSGQDMVESREGSRIAINGRGPRVSWRMKDRRDRPYRHIGAYVISPA